ncbi:hypothetical protein M758_3G096700 [Ceratodon purpureus]|uniref:Secreted protein n=1 Tax=Ceratodon purpureus TaxID=3225 RepID=A0A8T0IHW4_CERPU|nr:hypothetical protein KC19_3G093700 [Ceratodon purpureus]KAG0622428.1 hypothetical protein M758_3G096700 [Ceratodon purpureus]
MAWRWNRLQLLPAMDRPCSCCCLLLAVCCSDGDNLLQSQLSRSLSLAAGLTSVAVSPAVLITSVCSNPSSCLRPTFFVLFVDSRC